MKVFTNRQRDGIFRTKKLAKVHPFGFRSSVWPYPTGKHHTANEEYAFGHPALMPEKMAEDHILS